MPLTSVWSNFEIADMDFWRSEAYTAFFEYLDSKGGFYYEVSLSLFNCHLLCLTKSSLYLNSVGEMHRFIPSPRRFSYLDLASTFGTRSGTNTIRTHIVRDWGIIGRMGNVRVILRRVLVRFFFPFLCPLPPFFG
jgi:hypothetical protein